MDFDTIQEVMDETKSVIPQELYHPNYSMLDKILDPGSNLYQFNIDAINDKVYFQRLEKDPSLKNIMMSPQSKKEGNGSMNLTSQGFIQDYDKPVLRNQHLQVGKYTVLHLPENKYEEVKPLLKKDELIEIH